MAASGPAAGGGPHPRPVDITYKFVQPYIVEEEKSGSSVKVEFKCPVTSATFKKSQAMLKSDMSKAADKAKKDVKRSIFGKARRQLAKMLNEAMAGNREVANTVNRQVPHSVSTATEYSDSEQKEAVVKAFLSLEGRSLVWDPSTGQFISTALAKDVLPKFTQQLNEHPVVGHYNQGILARMLVEVSGADGSYGPDEIAFLQSMVPPECGTVESIIAKPRISAVELQEIKAEPGTRVNINEMKETMIMLCWALAYTDESLDAGEISLIKSYGQGLKMKEDKVEEMRRDAGLFLIGRTIEWVGADGDISAEDKQLIGAQAVRLGLAFDDVEREEIAFRKRRGML